MRVEALVERSEVRGLQFHTKSGFHLQACIEFIALDLSSTRI